MAQAAWAELFLKGEGGLALRVIEREVAAVARGQIEAEDVGRVADAFADVFKSADKACLLYTSPSPRD